MTIHPVHVTFDVPAAWAEWFDKFHNNFHFSPQELNAVRVGEGEWDTEYATVVNSVLPFGECIAHVGGEGWGKEGSSYGDTQLRVYVTQSSINDVVDHVATTGLSTARAVSRPVPNGNPEALRSRGGYSDQGFDHQWRIVSLQYPLWYGDYDGIARVRFYMTGASGQTLVFVFMGGDKEEIDGIMRSVQTAAK